MGFFSIGAAPDRRISDNDSTVLDLGANGSLISSTGSSVSAGTNTLAAAGTDEVLASSTSIHSVFLRGHDDNQGPIFIGPEGVSATTGFSVMTGVTIEIRTDNLADIWFDGDTTGDIVEFFAIVQ